MEIGIIIKRKYKKPLFCMLNLRCLSVLSIRYKKQKQQKIKLRLNIIYFHNLFFFAQNALKMEILLNGKDS
jgi:hypothetical protein